MKVLHLSDSTLSGAPYRASQLFNKYSGHESRHIVWNAVIYSRVFPTDLVGESMKKDELNYWLNWADIIHYHNRYSRQQIFKVAALPRGKKSVIQIHSPRISEDEDNFSLELASGIPLAVIAQYHVRQWPELKYIVPNVVDIDDPLHKPVKKQPSKYLSFGYAPSSPNGKGWDNKSYNIVNPVLKRLELAQRAVYNRIIGKPFVECMKIKQKCDVGIDEISTGSYHMASLEFLSQGVATIAGIDEQTERVVKDLTGSDTLPWIICKEKDFKLMAESLATHQTDIKDIGVLSRLWMETYWNQKVLCDHLLKMYEDL